PQPGCGGPALYEGGRFVNSGPVMVMAVERVVGLEQGSTLYRLLAGGPGSIGASLRWRISVRAVYAARAALAPAGAKGCSRMSMCQMASARRRAMSTWATLGPRCLPRRRLLRS